MSKTFNNYIGLAELPAKMFGSTMSIPDNVMGKYFELLTDVALKRFPLFLLAIKNKVSLGNCLFLSWPKSG